MSIPTKIMTVSVSSITQFAQRFFEDRVGHPLEEEGSPEPLAPDSKGRGVYEIRFRGSPDPDADHLEDAEGVTCSLRVKTFPGSTDVLRICVPARTLAAFPCNTRVESKREHGRNEKPMWAVVDARPEHPFDIRFACTFDLSGLFEFDLCEEAEPNPGPSAQSG